MNYKPIIFPTLVNCSWAETNLDSHALNDFPDKTQKNKLLNADFCDEWVREIALKLGADFSWGGHFEDRKHLWRGYYEDAEKVTHLGIDYNVPSGTVVSAPADCIVVHSWADTCTDNGWGGRLILRLEKPWLNAPYLILGHLAHRNLPKEGMVFKTGDIIAETGKPNENGGWFPHLHVQCANEDFYQQHIQDLTLLDGYYLVGGKPFDLAPSPKYLVGKDF